MVDQLRLLWNRPLHDGDRGRLFTIAAAVIAGATLVFAVADRPTSDHPRSTRPTQVPASPHVLTFPGPSTTSPAATPTVAPSEEGAATAPGTSRDVAAARRAAHGFLAGYLPYSYGRRDARRIRHASPTLRRQLSTERPRVPAVERRLHARVELLQTDGVSDNRAQLHALVDDGRRRYTIALELTRTPTGWTVTRRGD